jgi:hypothetical protein
MPVYRCQNHVGTAAYSPAMVRTPLRRFELPHSGLQKNVVQIDGQWRNKKSPEKPWLLPCRRYCKFMTFP